MPTPNSGRCLVLVATCSYLARALVAAESFAAQHPDADVALFVPDLSDRAANAVEWPSGGRLKVAGVDAITDARVAAMHSYFNAFELACAFKAFALHEVLFKRGYRQALLLDPDTCCLSSFSEVWQALDARAVCLTPHTNAPQPEDGFLPDDRELMTAGFANGGFWAASNSEPARRCIEWMQDKVSHFGFFLPRLNLYADQCWLSALPWLFPSATEIIRSPGYNAAYWNLHERRLRFHDEKFLCGNGPLVFFHFSGFDEARPLDLSRHSARHFGDETQAALARLLSDYAARLQNARSRLPAVSPDRPCSSASVRGRIAAYRAAHGARAKLKIGGAEWWRLGLSALRAN